MINNALINPNSIAIVGASNNLNKPGGGLVKNLLTDSFKGDIYPLNPREEEIQGLRCYKSISSLPNVDLAIIAIPALACYEAIKELTEKKNTQAFIVISAGFEESGEEGRKEIVKIKEYITKNSLSLIGPNCIGVMNHHYKAIFVSPPPRLSEKGIDFVSASGALAVFLFENAARRGVAFKSVFTVGNSTTNGIEEILQFWDKNFIEGESSLIKMVYAEQIRKPELFYRHVSSLCQKGCKVLVANPGISEAGSRAALSHTGAISENTKAAHLLIEKAGGILCSSREELISCAAILLQPKPKGKNFAVITHAGGPAVMLSDALQQQGIELPELDKVSQSKLNNILNYGASVLNPIDMLATGNGDQLEAAINICLSLDYINALVVIYGKTGMEDLIETYKKLGKSINKADKPIYCILPSVNSAREEIDYFNTLGIPHFHDEVLFAQSNKLIQQHSECFKSELYIPPDYQYSDTCPIDEVEIQERLRWAGIPLADSYFAHSLDDLAIVKKLKFPLVAKVMGVLHKTEVNGVIYPINSAIELEDAYRKIMDIPQSKGVLIQEMVQGTELYLGAKMHPGFGYSIHVGIGGVFIELINDTAQRLAPVSIDEATFMLNNLKSQQIFKGFRNQQPVNKQAFARLISSFSQIFMKYPDIKEIDLNPLIASNDNIIAVDARIII